MSMFGDSSTDPVLAARVAELEALAGQMRAIIEQNAAAAADATEQLAALRAAGDQASLEAVSQEEAGREVKLQALDDRLGDEIVRTATITQLHSEQIAALRPLIEAAAASGHVVKTIADGLAKTVNGEFFVVAGDGVSTYTILYYNNANAAVRISAYPDLVLVQGLDGRIVVRELEGAIADALGRGRDSIGKLVSEGLRDPDGRVAGMGDDGESHQGRVNIYPSTDRDDLRELQPLLVAAGQLMPLALNDRGELVIPGVVFGVSKDRDEISPYFSLLKDPDGSIAIGYDLGRQLTLLADVLLDVPIDRDSLCEMVSVIRDIERNNILAMRPDGLDGILSQAFIDRYNIGGGGGGTSVEFRPASEFLGSHGNVFNVRLGEAYRYATVQTREGYTADILQRLSPVSIAALPVSTEKLRYISGIGQSNMGSGSGPTGATIIVGAISDPFILRANKNSYASGTPSRVAGEATDFEAVSEPILANQAQSPTAMMALALARLDQRAGRRMPGTVISTSWQGGQPIGEFFPGAPTYPNLFENARIQSVDVRTIAASYNRQIDHTVLFIQGENASATPSYQAQFDSYIDTVLPQLGAASGIGGSPHFLVMQTHTNGGQSEQGSGLAQLAVARARLGAGMTLAGPMYQQPVWDPTHSNNPGRMIGGETAALAYEWTKIKGFTFNPLWPVAGGVTRVGNVITIPMELPLGTTALSIDSDWVAAIANYGLRYTDDSGAPPAILSVVVSGANIIVTLASDPTGANRRIRYALDDMTPTAGWPSTRGQIYADTMLPALFPEAKGPSTIRHYSARFEEIVP